MVSCGGGPVGWGRCHEKVSLGFVSIMVNLLERQNYSNKNYFGLHLEALLFVEVSFF